MTMAAAVALAVGLAGAASAATKWTVQYVPLPAGHTAQLTAVSCPTATTCFADGEFETQAPAVEQWNGLSWTSQLLPLPAGQNAATMDAISCASATACIAAGYYVTSEGIELPLVERWDGSTWKARAITMPASDSAGPLTGISCASPTSCTAVGYLGGGTGDLAPAVLHWNGTKWTVQVAAVPSGATEGGLLSAVSCPSPASCTVTGDSVDSTGLPTPLVEQWNGRTWTIETIQPAPSTETGLSGVSCTSASSCMVIGGYRSGTTGTLPLAEQWNGHTWAITATPLPGTGVNADLLAVSCHTAGQCTATGWWNNGVGHSALAEVWNGSTWQVQHTARPPTHRTLAAVSCAAASTCTTVGIVLPGGRGFYQPLAEHE
jgi:hypothetical protein